MVSLLRMLFGGKRKPEPPGRCSQAEPPAAPSHAQAISRIEEAGGSVLELPSGKVRVSFLHTHTRDEDLEHLKHLANLTSLR